jgi:3',5'-cyclic-AMP phosphodiesterase
MMLIAQITDMHVTHPGRLCYRRVDTGPYLERAVARILALPQRPDLLIATGDLIDLGESGEYRELRRLIEPLPMPVHLIPGNHDRRAALLDAFPDHRYLPRDEGFLHYSVEGWPVRLIGLDTLVEGELAGEMSGERLVFLDRALAAGRARPTLIFMHHPPFTTGIRGMDAIGLRGAAAMAQIVARHPEVQLITAGHLHRAIQRRFGGTIAATCPSTAHQVTLNLDPAAATSFMFEPPAFQLHYWDGEGLVTHTMYVDRFDGPHPFHDLAQT